MKVKYTGSCKVLADVDGAIKPETAKDIVCELLFEGKNYTDSEEYSGEIDKWSISIDSMELDLKEADDE